MDQTFHTLFFKQSMFDASEALQKPVDTKKLKSIHQYSWNSEVETTWISLLFWPHRTSNTYAVSNFHKFKPPITFESLHTGNLIAIASHRMLKKVLSYLHCDRFYLNLFHILIKIWCSNLQIWYFAIPIFIDISIKINQFVCINQAYIKFEYYLTLKFNF